MDTLWADVSEWQVPVSDAYPHPVLSIRCSDGTYRDKRFAVNYAWATKALDSGRLKALIVYTVYRTNWAETLHTVRDMVGNPHPRMAMMVDVEGWGGQITGNQSSGINGLYWGLAAWLGNPARVIGYGNVGDLNALWRDKPPGIRLVVAAYGSNPDYPGKIAHQFADNYVTPPFGACDINSADGMDPDAFCVAIGIGSTVPPPPPPSQTPPTPGPDTIPLMNFGETSDAVRHLQLWLNRMFPSYSNLPAVSAGSDLGWYGPETAKVIAEFQRRVGIIGGDGKNLGPRTRAALFRMGLRY